MKKACLVFMILIVLLVSCDFFKVEEYSLEKYESTDDVVYPAYSSTVESLNITYEGTPEQREITTDQGKSETWTVYNFDLNDCNCFDGSAYYCASRDSNSTSNNVVFYLAGGGMCLPPYEKDGVSLQMLTCAQNLNDGFDYVQQASIATATSTNPLADWNFLYAPYCDGSAHTGNTLIKTYNVDGKEVTRYHYGRKHTNAAVNVMAEVYPNPDKILIAGVSAGGYGTILSYMLIREKYPDAAIYIYNESGPALLNPGDSGRSNFIKESWDLNDLIPESPELLGDQLIFFYDWFLKNDPNLKIALYSSYADAVACSFLFLTPTNYKNLLVTCTNTLNNNHGERFRRFLRAGTSHSIGTTEALSAFNYETEIEGLSLYEWLGYFVADDTTNWVDFLED